MEINLVLNELSLQNPTSDKETARQWMSNFINTVKAVKAQGVKVYLRTKDNFHATILAPDYPLRRWLNDKEVDQVERGFIITLATGSPFSTNIANLDIQDIENNAGLSEFWHQGELAIGLAVAHLLDTVAISFIYKECWNFSRLELEARRLNENEELINDILEILHVSRSNHVQEHTEWIQNRIRTGVIDGDDLWERKGELFPNLEFCDAVSKQLRNIRLGQLELQPVVKTLLELEKCSNEWKKGYFNLDNYPVDESGESEGTLNKYGKERTFICIDGKERLFDRHIKLRFCNWRIHFFALKPGQVIIGYVGRHLPTVKYRT
ncbi:MAG: hypothetical protein RMZ41_018520 [Nostoc sp. DedVER02]|uniref:hypothetical protein n=1 Tax=unclassified Nostoc TaxID=2593658 RepID=UPI002AD578C3|nr:MULTISPECIES: hypothetical protein [unclassified Nostoc]MDZ7985127.1 hypothetical protein [Nostoc sp. DedVER02]MDZ8112860.1 hypothetical protein [Nostoc sp. DedVER01b]